MDLTWDGPDPKDKGACPYPVEFYCKPSPAESLNSLESGRILLEVGLGTGVTAVACQLINRAKLENLDKLQAGASKIKHQTSLSAIFAQDSQDPCKWVGELSIPSSWLEGTTSTHERTGAATPQSDGRSIIYTLEITYTLDNSNRCTARFASDDVFHWQARPT
ncbi:MAG: hypothetical protein M3270_11210 [Thermoproteota archaeon]|nr:hypothetical protein [Thermoproteota archaeon]